MEAVRKMTDFLENTHPEESSAYKRIDEAHRSDVQNAWREVRDGNRRAGSEEWQEVVEAAEWVFTFFVPPDLENEQMHLKYWGAIDESLKVSPSRGSEEFNTNAYQRQVAETSPARIGRRSYAYPDISDLLSSFQEFTRCTKSFKELLSHASAARAEIYISNDLTVTWLHVVMAVVLFASGSLS